MKLDEFIKQHCQDILQRAATEESSRFMRDYDGIEYDEDGVPIKVIYASTDTIHVDDVYSLDEDEFTLLYKTPEALQARNKLLSYFDIHEGLEALTYILDDMEREAQAIVTSFLAYRTLVDNNDKPDEQGSLIERNKYDSGW